MARFIKTTLLLIAMTGLLMLIGGLIGGQRGVAIFFVIAAVMNFFSYWFSDKIVLRAYNAREIDAQTEPELYSIVNELAHSAGIPMPRLYIIESDTPNAFATGRNSTHAAVAVTRGILRICTREELKGVIGHELSHVINRDSLTSSLVATLAGAIMMIGTMIRWGAIFGLGNRDDEEGGGLAALLIGGILAPVPATLSQLAISRPPASHAHPARPTPTHNPPLL